MSSELPSQSQVSTNESFGVGEDQQKAIIPCKDVKICKKLFCSEQRRKRHFENVRTIKKCYLCLREYDKKAHFRNHKVCHWQSYRSCPLCKSEFGNVNKFLQHLDHHSEYDVRKLSSPSVLMVDILPLTPHSLLHDDYEFVIEGEFTTTTDEYSFATFKCSTLKCCDSEIKVSLKLDRMELVDCGTIDKPPITHTKPPRTTKVLTQPQSIEGDAIKFSGKTFAKEWLKEGVTKYKCTGCPTNIYFDGDCWCKPVSFFHTCS